MELIGNEPQLIESIYHDVNSKKYYIKGKFASIEQKNQNNRIYPREIWETEVLNYQSNIQKGSINTLMEWEHPRDRLTVDPIKAVAKIQKLWIEGNYVYGEAVLLDTPQAEIIKSLINNRIQMSVSSRGTGNVDNDGIVRNFKLITFDIVACPSDQSATMYGVYESIDEKKLQTIHLTQVGNVIMETAKIDDIKKIGESESKLFKVSDELQNVTKDQENVLNDQIKVLESLESLKESIKESLIIKKDYEIKEERLKNIIDAKDLEIKDLKETIAISENKINELQKSLLIEEYKQNFKGDEKELFVSHALDVPYEDYYSYKSCLNSYLKALTSYEDIYDSDNDYSDNSEVDNIEDINDALEELDNEQDPVDYTELEDDADNIEFNKKEIDQSVTSLSESNIPSTLAVNVKNDKLNNFRRELLKKLDTQLSGKIGDSKYKLVKEEAENLTNTLKQRLKEAEEYLYQIMKEGKSEMDLSEYIDVINEEQEKFINKIKHIARKSLKESKKSRISLKDRKERLLNKIKNLKESKGFRKSLKENDVINMSKNRYMLSVDYLKPRGDNYDDVMGRQLRDKIDNINDITDEVIKSEVNTLEQSTNNFERVVKEDKECKNRLIRSNIASIPTDNEDMLEYYCNQSHCSDTASLIEQVLINK